MRQKRRASASIAVSPLDNDESRRLKAATKKNRNTMDATVTVRPIHPPSFERISEMQTIPEHSVDDFDVATGQPAGRPSMPRTPYPTYPMYPGLQSHSSEPGKGPALPTMLNRPRKLSGSTTGTVSSGESVGSDMRTSSWGSRPTSFDSAETTGWRPSYQRPALSATQRIPVQPDEMFAALPGEVLDLILAKLKQLHVGRGSNSCATCWTRDLCNVSLCSRKWARHARSAL